MATAIAAKAQNDAANSAGSAPADDASRTADTVLAGLLQPGVHTDGEMLPEISQGKGTVISELKLVLEAGFVTYQGTSPQIAARKAMLKKWADENKAYTLNFRTVAKDDATGVRTVQYNARPVAPGADVL